MDEISKAIKGARAAQVGRIYGSFSNAQQVSSDDDSIRKSKEVDGELEKSRSGVYVDTAENRRLGRVGQHYGNDKQGEKVKKISFNTPGGKKISFFRDRYGYGGLTIDDKKYADSDVYYAFNEDKKLARIYVTIDGNRKIIDIPKQINNIKKAIEEVDLFEGKVDYENPFEKASEEADVEKSDVMDALSSQGDIKVSKTGKEIKDQVDTVLLPAMMTDLAIKEDEADKELKNCGIAPTKDPDRWWTDGIKMDCGFKIYDWEETYVPSNSEGKMMSSLSVEDAKDKKENVPENQEQANCRRAYNDIVRAICNIKVDIKACEILKTLKDGKQFELSPRQVLALRF